jgi:hypothetical protein
VQVADDDAKKAMTKDAAAASHDAEAEKAAADKARHDATDHFAAMHGDFVNAVDALGNSHELRMAKSHANQAMEWVHRHMHPDPSATMPNPPPPVPPVVA